MVQPSIVAQYCFRSNGKFFKAFCFFFCQILLWKEGEPWKEKGSGRHLQNSAMRKKRLCQTELKSQLASTRNICDRYNELAGTFVCKSTVSVSSSEIILHAEDNCNKSSRKSHRRRRKTNRILQNMEEQFRRNMAF